MAHQKSDQMNDVEVNDPENPEWTKEDFARARPAHEVFPPVIYKKLIDNFNKHQALKLEILKEKIPA